MRSLVLRPDSSPPKPPSGQRPPRSVSVPWPYRFVAVCNIGVSLLHLLAAASLLSLGRAAAGSPELLAVFISPLWTGAATLASAAGLAWLVTAIGLRRGQTWGLVGTVLLLLIILVSPVLGLAAGRDPSGHIVPLAYGLLMLAALLAGALQAPPHSRQADPSLLRPAGTRGAGISTERAIDLRNGPDKAT